MLLEHKCPSAVQGDLEQADCSTMSVMNGCPSPTQALTLGVGPVLFLFVYLVGRAVEVRGGGV